MLFVMPAVGVTTLGPRCLLVAGLWSDEVHTVLVPIVLLTLGCMPRELLIVTMPPLAVGVFTAFVLGLEPLVEMIMMHLRPFGRGRADLAGRVLWMMVLQVREPVPQLLETVVF